MSADMLFEGTNQGKTFYVATALGNAAAQRAIASRLASYGHVLTYDWTTHGSVMDKSESVKKLVAASEIDGVEAADVVVCLLPGGFGTHVELGMAIAGNKLTIVVGSQVCATGYSCIFYHSKRVYWIEGEVDWNDCTKWDAWAGRINDIIRAHGDA